MLYRAFSYLASIRKKLVKNLVERYFSKNCCINTIPRCKICSMIFTDHYTAILIKNLVTRGKQNVDRQIRLTPRKFYISVSCMLFFSIGTRKIEYLPVIPIERNTRLNFNYLDTGFDETNAIVHVYVYMCIYIYLCVNRDTKIWKRRGTIFEKI